MNLNMNMNMNNLVNLIKITISDFTRRPIIDKIALIYLFYGSYKTLKNIKYIDKKKINNRLFHYFKNFKFVKNQIESKKAGFNKKIKNELNETIVKNNIPTYTHLLTNGLSNNNIINSINKNKKLSLWKNNKISGAIYSHDTNLNNLMDTIFPIYYRSNPLHPDLFPGVRKMEAEIVQMCAGLMSSKSKCSGSFTTGGTESIILACRTYRELAKQRGISNPNILVCKNAHAAYWKAADYLNIDLIEVDFDKHNNYGKLTLDIVKNNINKNTIAVITSAPSFNFGLVDEIKEIGLFCYYKDIMVHIDMCLGGFILPFTEKFKEVSFDLNGITSISMDTHKYGCGPKGGSVILYRDETLFKQQMFIKHDWTGGVYGTANITGSRCGNTVALTWATMMSIGFNGYVKNTESIVELTFLLKKNIDEMSDVYCMGIPDVCIVAIGSDLFDIYLLSDKLKDKGWNLNILQNPNCFHLCITNCHNEEIILEFIEDIRESVNTIKNEIEGCEGKIESKCLYGTTQKIDNDAIIDDVVRDYFCILNDIN